MSRTVPGCKILTLFYTSRVLIHSKSIEDITLCSNRKKMFWCHCIQCYLYVLHQHWQKIVQNDRYLIFIFYVFAVQSEECWKIFLVLAFISNIVYSRPGMPYIRHIVIKLIGIVLFFCLPDEFFLKFYYTILNLHVICHEDQFWHLGILV